MDIPAIIRYFATSISTYCYLEGLFFGIHEIPESFDSSNRFVSDIFLEYEMRWKKSGAENIHITMTEKEFFRIFDRRFPEAQRFAVVFGRWWGLTDVQIGYLSDITHKMDVLSCLSFFLVHPESEALPESLEDTMWAEHYYRLSPEGQNLGAVSKEIVMEAAQAL